MDIRRTDLDGLTTFSGEAPGPAQAWLVFRVGSGDETLLTRGITRLVTGLALEGVGSGPAAYGAFTGGPTTSFELDGEPDQVTEMLGQIWEGLTAFVPERFEARRAKEIEYAGWRVPDVTDHFLATRFGPRNMGLAGQPEIGLHHLDAPAVVEWRDRYFTTSNAALALKNLSPDDVPTPSLPRGERRAPVAPAPKLLTLPAWFEERVDDVAVSALLPATAAADAFTATAVARIRARLGDAHRVELTPVRLWTGIDHVVLRCTTPSRSALRVRDVMLAVIEELAARGPDEIEIAERRGRLREWRADPVSTIARLEWAAHARLLEPDAGDSIEDDEPPSPAEVASVARELAATAIYRVPPGTGMPPGYAHLARWSSDAVEGDLYERVADDPGNLVLGSEGVTVTIGDRRVTIRFDACEAAAQWPDGTLDLYGSDGFGAQVRPGEWAEGESIVAEVARRLGGRVVRMRRPAPDG